MYIRPLFLVMVMVMGKRAMIRHVHQTIVFGYDYGYG